MENLNRDNIKNLYFVGRNYIKHVEELNNEKPEFPLIFTKSLSTLTTDKTMKYPSHSKNVHFEGEMVFMIPDDNFITDEHPDILVGCGLDFTARDVQDVAKKKGWPWFGAKCFAGSSVISNEFVSVSFSELASLEIKTLINGQERQHGTYSQKMFKLEEILEFIGNTVSFSKGDVIFTGTPSGVGEVKKGDKIKVLLIQNNKILTEAFCEVK